jgi:hypothetical protein
LLPIGNLFSLKVESVDHIWRDDYSSRAAAVKKNKINRLTVQARSQHTTLKLLLLKIVALSQIALSHSISFSSTRNFSSPFFFLSPNPTDHPTPKNTKETFSLGFVNFGV